MHPVIALLWHPLLLHDILTASFRYYYPWRSSLDLVLTFRLYWVTEELFHTIHDTLAHSLVAHDLVWLDLTKAQMPTLCYLVCSVISIHVR